jgi:maltose O-acetyltransferase
MKIGRNVHIMPGVFFDEAYASLISIGDNCTITSGVKILAHDASLYRDLNMAKMGRVIIKDNCFIGVNSIILPGIVIGPDAVVGAGTVVAKDVPSDSVAMGNPAKVVMSKREFLKRQNEKQRKLPVIGYEDFFNSKVDINSLTSAYLKGGEKYTNLKWLDEERISK